MHLRFALFAAALLWFAAPGSAHAAQAPASSAAAAEEDSGERADPAPLEQREDWIAVAGIVCYSVVPVVLLAAAGYLAYRFFARESAGALQAPWDRSGWMWRGAHAAGRPAMPDGLVLWRF